MGYTTKFTGRFDLNNPLALAHAAILEKMSDDSLTEEDWAEFAPKPDSYFQWQPTSDRKGIEWNGGEKFYHYEEWLQWLMDRVLAKWKYKLTGHVEYRGEDQDDWGVLAIIDGRVSKQASPLAQWRDIKQSTKEEVLEMLKEAARELNDLSHEQHKAVCSAMALLSDGIK